MGMKFSLLEKDLDFIIKTLAPESKDKNLLKRYINEDDSFRENALGDQKLFQKIWGDQGITMEISPLLFFEMLLRKAVREMESYIYTVERSMTMRIPVFDIEKTLDLMKEPGVIYYLAQLLEGFVKHDRPSPPRRTTYFKCRKLGDRCLFILGIFPEYLRIDYYSAFSRRGNIKYRTVGDYEMLGKKCYSLAAGQKEAREDGLDQILDLLSGNISLAKKPLNVISNYLALKPIKNP